MPFSTAYANDILNWAMGRTDGLIRHEQVWIGLCYNDPEADKGEFRELSGYGYGRVLVSQFGEVYPGLISAANERLIANGKQIAFTKATGGDWLDSEGNSPSGYGLFTVPTGGTPFFYAKLNEPVPTPAGSVFLFDPNELKISFKDVDEDITE